MREAAGAVDRVLPGDGVPARPDQHSPPTTGCLDVRRRPRPGWPSEVAATGGPRQGEDRDPMAELVRAQRLAVPLAPARGLDPDRPRHLTRSVILA